MHWLTGTMNGTAIQDGAWQAADILVHEVMDLSAMIAEGFPEELSDVFKSVHIEVSDVGRIAAAAGI